MAAAPRQELIGVLGGISPESTVDYYQRINAGVRASLGGLHSARMCIYSADLQQVYDWLGQEQDEALADHLVSAARNLERSGARFVILACNSAHKVAPRLEDALTIPFVHIADVLGERLREEGISRLGLLSTRFTATAPFYSQRLLERFGISMSTPDAAGIEEVDRIIREELCFRDLRPESLAELERLAAGLKERGVEALALGCTELGLLVDGPRLAGLPVFDTTALHTERAVDLSLGRAEWPREVA